MLHPMALIRSDWSSSQASDFNIRNKILTPKLPTSYVKNLLYDLILHWFENTSAKKILLLLSLNNVKYLQDKVLVPQNNILVPQDIIV